MSEDTSRSVTESNAKQIEYTRRLLLASLGGAATGGLAGCLGDGAEDTPSASPTAEDDDEMGGMTETPSATATPRPSLDEFAFLTWNQGFFKDSIKQIQQEFKEQGYQDTEVTWLDKAGSDVVTFFKTRLQSGNAPEQVMLMGPSYLQFINEDVLTPLEPILSDEFLSKFKYKDYNRVDGKLYRLPNHIIFQTTYFRKKFFEEAGIDPPTLDDPYSTPRILDVIKEVVDNSSAEYGFTMLRFNYMISNLFVTEGVDILNEDNTKAAFNTSRTKEIFQRLKTLTEDGYIPRLTWTKRWQEPIQQFAGGNTAMFLGGETEAFMIENFGGDWVSADSVGYVGGIKNTSPIIMMGMTAVGANKTEQEKQAAGDFIETWLSTKWQKAYMNNNSALAGNNEAATELANSDEFNNKHALWARGIEVGDVVIPNGWLPPQVPSSFRIMETINSELSGAVLGEKSIDDALASAESKVNQALQSG